MSQKDKELKEYSYVESRWARLGPYYAMFPMEFAYDVIAQYSNKGDLVFDPFAGRGSGTYAAVALERKCYGIEINPVGWLYSTTKLCPASKEDVMQRLRDIVNISANYSYISSELSEFYQLCFSHDVLSFLLASRELLDWKNINVDATLMAFILHYLHGKRGQSLSNQMPMAKSTSIQYSINWWKRKGYVVPPQIDVIDFFEKRLNWRYNKGYANHKGTGIIVLNDSTIELKSLRNNSAKNLHQIDLLFTSPPYYGVTNYYVDQWLRLWLLGGADKPTVLQEKHKSRFASKEEYEALLDNVFGECAKMMSPKGKVYVRTDYREFTLNTTKSVLKKHFPDHQLTECYDYCHRKSQTEFLNNSTQKVCEVDLVLQ